MSEEAQSPSVLTDRSFEEVLDQALTARRLSLERVVSRLSAAGVKCSMSTLSLWRRGRIRPSLPRSQAVLEALEPILGLQRGELLTAARNPRVGDPGWWNLKTSISSMSSPVQAFNAFREATGLPDVEDLDRLFVHVVMEFDVSGALRRAALGQVVRARRDGASQFGVFHWTDYRTLDGLPVVHSLRAIAGGAVTHQVEFSDLGATAGVVELDEVLSEGEITAVDVELLPVTAAEPRRGFDFWEVQMPWPVGQITLEVRFDGEPPTSLHGRSASRLVPGQLLEDLPATSLPRGQSVQVCVADVAGGGARIEWDWGGGPS